MFRSLNFRLPQRIGVGAANRAGQSLRGCGRRTRSFHHSGMAEDLQMDLAASSVQKRWHGKNAKSLQRIVLLECDFHGSQEPFHNPLYSDTAVKDDKGPDLS